MIESMPVYLYFFIAILGLLALDFFIRFVLSAIRVRRELHQVLLQLEEPGANQANEIGAIFANTRIMKPLWREYADSLHEQIEIDPISKEEKLRRRSTVPASVFFRPDIIVDIPLRADFFRHLPGIFTGVGIIGTFTGLLDGLHAFQISDDPSIVRYSLASLLQGVSMAFIVSAAAITLAMVVTFIEKLILNSLYAKVEALVQRLDDAFVAGVGEEYLARLVRVSESTADQAASMQSALVGELRQIMAEQTEKQVFAINMLGNLISGSVENSLKAPLGEMTDAVKNVAADQSGAVHTMMHELLSGFNKNLRDLLGDQIAHINTAQETALNSLSETISRLDSMVLSIESAGERSAMAMASQLASAMSGAELRQQNMNEKMDSFVGQLTQSVVAAQDAQQAELKHALDDIVSRMGVAILDMGARIQAASESNRHTLEEFNKSLRELLGEQIAHVSVAQQATLDSLNETVSRLNNMAGNIESAGERGAAAMANQLASVLSGAEIRQQNMNEKMDSFVEQLTQSVFTSQDAQQARLKYAFDDIANRMGSVILGMSTAIQAASESGRQTLDEFNTNLRHLLSEQTVQINTAQQAAFTSFREAESRLESMGEHIESVGERGALAMANQLALAMEAAQARQQIMNEKMDAFVELLTQSVSTSQEAQQARLQYALDDIANRMGAVIQSMSTQIVAASESGRQIQSEMMNRSVEAIGGIGGQVDLLVDGVLNATEEMKSTVNALRYSTGESLSQMNAGADRLYRASVSFAESGREMTEVLGKAAALVGQFDKTTETISGVSGELGRFMADYQTSREVMTTFFESLRTGVEQISRESRVTDEVLVLIEEATSRLVDAQKEADGFLHRIADVIRESHHAFTSGMVRSVDIANSDFHRALSDSIALLQIGIQDLAATLEEFGSARLSSSEGVPLIKK